MTDTLSQVRPARRSPGPRRALGASLRDEVLAEVCASAFASLPRTDQRRKGVQYVRGLLEAYGRKSIRNIATAADGRAPEQGLHHFVASSTWNWAQVRESLAAHVVAAEPNTAWVVHPMVIPKVGEHSVGVARRYIPGAGQVINAQEAVGVWLAGDETSFPVNWRLHLPADWIGDHRRRAQAAIPESMDPESLTECTVQAALEVIPWTVPARPVIVDAREPDASVIVRRLRARRIPFLIRVPATMAPGLADTAMAGHASDELYTAHRIMTMSRQMRRPVIRSSHDREDAVSTDVLASVRVRLPGRGGEADLLGVGAYGRPWPCELWLTDVGAPPVELIRLRRLLDRVDREAPLADRVGLRDFAGRSYHGWHRHTTLASIAYTVVMLAGQADPRSRGELPVA
jgi:hypothetical protein